MSNYLRVTVFAVCAHACLVSAAEVEIERMTSPEVGAAVLGGKTIILIPTGGTEQNGPHMVLGKHNFIVKETVRQIAERLGNALVAPVIAYVPEGDIERREGHMAYPGTVSLPPALFAATLEAAAASFRMHGFKTIVFIGDSGPNQAPQRETARKLTAAWAAHGVRVIAAEKYYAANGAVAWLKTQGETDASIGTHAGIQDTSELLAVYPNGVSIDRARANKQGFTGNPERASAERGRKLIALKVDAAVREITTELQHAIRLAK